MRYVYKCFYVIFGCLFFASFTAEAQDITAVDFSGEQIGKVIPDGTAINFNNEIIGQLTADGFIVNFKGNIIGGIVAQGFAVSNDQKYLGKVSADGSVRLPSGKTAGKVLPSGLVVDEFYHVIGSILATGIVYNDEGKAVGRLAGNGAYINFDGQTVGFVSTSGYAYRQTDNTYRLEGKLISAKMVVSLKGDFIGSVAPGGQVADFDGTFIGRVHANGYVYDKDNKVIGSIVKTAYAFDSKGKYLGFVSYNGEVLSEGKVIGHWVSGDKIADTAGEIIGFAVDINAVAVDDLGKYLGYIVPNGQIVRGKETVGFIAPRGVVVDGEAKQIGQIADKGPVFDYLGNLKAEAVANGQVVSFDGSFIGFMKGSNAFDNIGMLMGRTLKPSLIVNLQQDIIGISGVGTEISDGSRKYKISPLGYVYGSNDMFGGHLLNMAPTYTQNGDVFAYFNENGQINLPIGSTLKLHDCGVITDANYDIQGGQINPSYAFLYGRDDFVNLSDTNVFYDAKSAEVAKILPFDAVVSVSETLTPVPVAGESSFGEGVVLTVKGDTFGYVNARGLIYNTGKQVGRIAGRGIAVNQKDAYAGEFKPFGAVVNENCDVVGMVDSKGEVRSNRNNFIGKMLLNGQVVSEVGQNMGHLARKGPLFGFDGRLVGMANEIGQVLDDKGQIIGCLNDNGRLYDEMNFKGRVLENDMIMDFGSRLIGRLNLKNQAVDDKGKVIGFSTPDGSIVNEANENLGLLFKYKVAFDRDNNFVGYVAHDGQVYNDQKEVFGKVMYDGLVVNDNKAVGYALYDLYVYDESGKVLGYLTKNSMVTNFAGQNLGKANRGFLVQDGRLIGRPNRDYFARNSKNEVVGEILLSGNVVDMNGVIIGVVSGSGDVRDTKGRSLGVARPLQYYIVKDAPKLTEDNELEKISVGTIDVGPQEVKPLESYAQKVIGVVISPEGKYIGNVLETGEVIDLDSGAHIGFIKDDGAYDDNDNFIGTVDISVEPDEKVKPIKSEPSMPFVPASAYSTDDVVDLGPGGGFGQGERYDPMRSYFLSEAQKAHVQDIKVGKLSSKVKPSSFTGYQDNWDNANYKLSSWRVDMSEMILADKPIPAVLARTIVDVGDTSGVPVTAIVERNVYAEDGRNVVIPAGSRVMGSSSGGLGGGTSGGAVRTSITWTRLVRPDGSAFEFADAQTGDAQGRGGALGYLDEQLLKRYMAPIATNLATNALAFVMASGSETTSSNGSTTQDARAAAAQDARQGFQNDMQQVFQDLMQRMTNIQTVTYVPAGTRLIIYPKVDLWLRTFEREQSDQYSKEAMDKPEAFIDDRDPVGSLHKGNAGGKKTTSGGGSSTVAYDGENVNVQPAAPVLIDDAALKKKNRQQKGATPPPPSISSGSGSKSSDSSSGALF